jgi:hypothetical protein
VIASEGDDDIVNDSETTKADVGSEGGSPGDVEVVREWDPGEGSEAGETLQPAADRLETIVRDATGKGRRSP